MAAWVCDELTQIQRAQGRLDAAASTCRQVLDVTALPGGAHLAAAGSAYVGLADVAYQRNELDRALDEVNRGITLCRQFVHSAPLARGLTTLAWIRNARGDQDGARQAMAEAVRAGPGPVGLVNPAPALRARLLLAQDRPDAGYLARLQRALGQAAEPGCPQPGLVDPLTSRELEVLGLLAAGKPNQAIARELVIPLDTVKKHVGHVLAKLGAANRTEAVARAHELDLLT